MIKLIWFHPVQISHPLLLYPFALIKAFRELMAALWQCKITEITVLSRSGSPPNPAGFQAATARPPDRPS